MAHASSVTSTPTLAPGAGASSAGAAADTGASTNAYVFDTHHDDLIHDAQLDYYGRYLASASSDRSVRVFQLHKETAADGTTTDSTVLIDILKGHDGPVWQVAWSHPAAALATAASGPNYAAAHIPTAPMLATCSYDGRVIIWRQVNGPSHAAGVVPAATHFAVFKEHRVHEASVNAIAWAPREFGPKLACASADGRVSILSLKPDGSWDTRVFPAHNTGVNSISWAPCLGSSLTGGSTGAPQRRILATGGCDSAIRIWVNDSEDDEDSWSLDHEINDAHTNWVRDVAFSQRLIPTASGSDALSLVLASCSQDRTVVIHSRPVASLAAAAGATPVATWTNVRLPGPRATATADATDATPPKEGLWPAAVWRVSWSPSGVILAVSDATGGVTLWSPTAGESSIAGLVWEEIAQ